MHIFLFMGYGSTSMDAEEKIKELPEKPSLIRQLAPVVLAAGILAYMFYKVDFAEVWWHLKRADGVTIIIAYLVYCLVYYVTDILSFWRAYNLFNTGIGFAETGRLRLAAYAVQAVNGAITEIMAVLYMFRVKKVPVLGSTSSAGFVYFNETVTMVLFLAYCAFYLPADRRIVGELPWVGLDFWAVFQWSVVVLLVLGVLWLVLWRTGIKDRFPRLRDNGALVAFRKGTVANYLEIFGYRFSNNIINILANVFILKAMGIDAPLALLFAAVPLMVNIAYWPISVGGFGGPQLVGHYLLRGYAGEAEILAYTLVWSSLFFLSRTLTGVWFISPVYRAAFPKKSRIAGKRQE